jgi:hypothetical protein
MLRFPEPPRAVEANATRFTIWRLRLPMLLGRLAMACGLPGAMRDTEINDELTKMHVTVRLGVLFTRITVNGRDFYFNRFTGRFDGTGSAT